MKLIAFLFLIIGMLNVVNATELTQPEYGEFGGFSWVSLYKKGPNVNVQFKDVEAYCQTVIGGQSGWRIPTMSELAILIKANHSKDWFGPAIFTYTAETETTNYGIKYKGYYVGLDTSRFDGNDAAYLCVHASLASNKKFTKDHMLCATSNHNGCKPINYSGKMPSDNKPKSTHPSSADKTTVNPKKNSAGGNQPGLVLTKHSAASEDAATAKAAVEANKKEYEEQKKKLATAKKRSDEKQAIADKETQLKAKGKVVKQVNYDRQLDENQAKTWCQRKVPELQESFRSGKNELISIGECTCKQVGVLLFSKQFECDLPYTMREFTTNRK